MISTARMPLLLAAGTLLLAACDELPTQSPAAGIAGPQASQGAGAPAERTVYENLYDMTDTYFSFPCDEAGNLIEDGELIRLEGSVYEKVTFLRDEAGGYHSNLNTMPVGLRGVGVDSGEEFRVSEHSRGGSNQTRGGISGHYRQDLKLAGQATRRAFVMVFSGNYHEDENNNLIVQRDRERVECRV